MAKMSKGLLSWRKKQPKGAIMKPETFNKIVEEAKEGGATNPEAVGGAAYWKTAKKKFTKRGGK